MAQDITGNPWWFTTATAPGDDLHKNGFDKSRVHLKQIVWNGATAVGHRCTIKDKNNRVIFDALAGVVNEEKRQGDGGMVDGVNITQLDSGVVTIFNFK
jgi:hypothetical protein